jgi:hypothetical protein
MPALIEWDGSPWVFLSGLISVLNGYFSVSEFDEIMSDILALAIEYEQNQTIKRFLIGLSQS